VELTVYVKVITVEETVNDDIAVMSPPPTTDTEPVLALNQKIW
jgi:hypothetical protein